MGASISNNVMRLNESIIPLFVAYLKTKTFIYWLEYKEINRKETL